MVLKTIDRPVVLEEWPVLPEESELVKGFDRAIELLSRPYGWIKNRLRTERKMYGGPAYCSIGVLIEVFGEDRNKPTSLLERALSEQGIDPSIMYWNDRIAKKRDVIALFQRARQLAKEVK